MECKLIINVLHSIVEKDENGYIIYCENKDGVWWMNEYGKEYLSSYHQDHDGLSYYRDDPLGRQSYQANLSEIFNRW